jgi:hypothetical protein
MIPQEIEDKMLEVVSYTEDIDDWVTIKKEIVKHIRWQLRTLFSRRHPITKQQQTNDFEIEVMKRWVELGGRELHI